MTGFELTHQNDLQHIYVERNTEILEMIATGKSAPNIYDAIALMYESKSPGLRCSLLELKGDRLMHGGAPSLPKEYCNAVNGLKNGPDVGSCGTSTFTGKRVLVEDIATDPKWNNIKHIALPHGIRSCWSEPIKNSGGKVLGAFGMYYDTPSLPSNNQLLDLESAGRLASIVMDRDHREKELRLSQKMDAIGQLTGGIAHDFNNSLGIILGSLELLELEPELNSKTKKRLGNIKYAANRAAKLTKKLLTISSSENENASVTDINQIISSMQNILVHSLTPQIEIVPILAKDLWQTVINPGDFEDALLNLALNARDALSGSGKLTIETKNCILDETYCKLNLGLSPGEYVQLSVSDNGEGIEQELQDRVFDPFFTTKNASNGSGLGLSMVLGFIKRSSGGIKVYSEAGIGTTFQLYLPRARQKQKITAN